MSGIRKELSQQFDAATSGQPRTPVDGAGRWGPGAWRGRGGSWAPKAGLVPSPSAKTRRPSFENPKLATSPLVPGRSPFSQQQGGDKKAAPKEPPPKAPSRTVSLSGKDTRQQTPPTSLELDSDSAKAPPARRRSSGGAIAGLRAIANAVASPTPTRGRREALVIHVLDEPRGVQRDFVFDRGILLNEIR